MFRKILVAPFLLLLLSIPTGSVYGKTVPVTDEINNGEPYVEFYDENENLIERYTGEEVEKFFQQPIDPEILEEPEVNSDAPYVHIYDENNFVVDSTDENVIKAQKEALEAVNALALSTYKYGPATFTYNIWIGGGKSFINPQSVTIYPKKTVYSITVRVVRTGSTEAGRVKIGNFSSGINVPISQYTKSGTQYQIQFINSDVNQRTIYLDTGHVYY